MSEESTPISLAGVDPDQSIRFVEDDSLVDGGAKASLVSLDSQLSWSVWRIHDSSISIGDVESADLVDPSASTEDSEPDPAVPPLIEVYALDADPREEIAGAATLPRKQKVGDYPAENGDASDGSDGRATGPSDAGNPVRPVGQPVFRLRRLIGSGGNGEVWEAEQTSLSRLIAIKRIKSAVYRRFRTSPAIVRRREAEFRQEVLITARLDHPNIVSVIDLGVDGDGRPLLAMRLVSGAPWGKMIARDRKEQSWDEFLRKHLEIFIDVAQAIAYAHSRGVVHRDIKPSQVVVGQYGETMLMDWGLALFTGSAEYTDDEDTLPPPDGLPSPTTATSPAGTPAMMAPEQTRRDAFGIGPWTDIYLLGGTLYHILTGTFPHSAETAQHSFERARKGEVVSADKVVTDRELPRELVELTVQCLKPNAQHRPVSAAAIVERLRAFLSGAASKSEALVLYDQAALELNRNTPATYSRLNDAASFLSRASTLWPNAPEARVLEATLYSKYSKLALSNDDLELAAVYIDRLHANGTSQDDCQALASELGSKKASKKRIRRQRAVYGSLAGLLGVLLLLGWGFYQQVQARNAIALAAKNEALTTSLQQLDAAHSRVESELKTSEELRLSADRFVEIFLSEVAPQLDRLGDLEYLSGAVTSSLEYLESLPPHELTEERNRSFFIALVHAGNVNSAKGDYEAALKKYDRALELIDPTEPEDDRESYCIRLAQLRQLLVRYSDASWRLDQSIDAISQLRRAVEIGEEIKEIAPHLDSQLDFKLDRAKAELQLGHILRGIGETVEGDVLISNATKRFRFMYDALPQDPDIVRHYGACFRSLAHSALQLGDRTTAIESIRLSSKLLGKASLLDPVSELVRTDLDYHEAWVLELTAIDGGLTAAEIVERAAEMRSDYLRKLDLNTLTGKDFDLLVYTHVRAAALLHKTNPPAWSESLDVAENALSILRTNDMKEGGIEFNELEGIRGRALYELGAKESGLNALRQAYEGLSAMRGTEAELKARVSLISCGLRLGTVLQSEGDLEASREVAREVLEIYDDPMFRVQLGVEDLERYCDLLLLAGDLTTHAEYATLLSDWRSVIATSEDPATADAPIGLPIVSPEVFGQVHAVLVSEIVRSGDIIDGQFNVEFVRAMHRHGVRHPVFDQYVAALLSLDAQEP